MTYQCHPRFVNRRDRETDARLCDNEFPGIELCDYRSKSSRGVNELPRIFFEAVTTNRKRPFRIRVSINAEKLGVRLSGTCEENRLQLVLFKSFEK